MRICILDDAYESSASPLRNYDLTCDPTPFLGGHDCETVPLVKQTAVAKLIELSRGGYDLFSKPVRRGVGPERYGSHVSDWVRRRRERIDRAPRGEATEAKTQAPGA